MTDRAKRLVIGLFVLAAFVSLGALVVMFGSLPTMFKRANVYTIRFTDATGVAQGTPVRRSGVRIGEVREVILDEERGIVRVQVAIDPRFSLRRNEQATLTVSLLGGDAVIDFVPQPAEEGQPVDRAPLEPGAEIVGVRPAGVNTLLNRASEVAPTAQETLNDIRRSLQRLDRLSPVADETMREYRDLAKEIRRNLPNLERTNQEYQDLAKDIRRNIPELEKTNKGYQDLARNINRIIPDLEQTNKEYQGLAKDVRKALPDVQHNIDDVGAAARTWGKLGERLNVWATSNLDSLTKSIENLNTVLTRLSSILNEENQRNLAAILKNTRAGSERFDSISRNLDGILQDSRALPKRVNDTLTSTEAAMNDLRKAVGPFSTRSETISRNVEEVLIKHNRLASDLLALMQALDHDGTVQRLLKDPSLYINLNEAACALVKSIPRLDRILKDLETFADKLARHPELLGVRGAVRPSNGVKEPPQPYQPPILVPGP